jgi:hypothetical protein
MKTALRVWWGLTWRALLLTLAAGAVSGFLLGVIFGFAHVPDQLSKRIAALVNVPLGVYLGVWVVRRMMTHGFGRYRLVVKLRESA